MSLTEFTSRLDFTLDDYQVQACHHLEAGSGVLVAAPTGAGKTVVGEFAVHLAHHMGSKCFYTTPIKALSNQKYHDLVEVYGHDQVGLLTGDQVINSEADIAVMTTEVLRNMIYAGSPTLQGLEYVVMDEVHYLADPLRGPVWEEVILGLDPSVKIIGLSATVSNIEQFGAWMQKVRGDVAIVVSENRPVPLFQHVFAGRRLVDLYENPLAGPGSVPKVNSELMRLAAKENTTMRDDSRRMRGRSGKGKRGTQSGLGSRPHGRYSAKSHLVPRRTAVVNELNRLDLLPAIFFIFSRQGCDQAVRNTVDDEVWLTNKGERDHLGQIASSWITGLSDTDLEALRYHDWLDAFTRGISAHHAGLLPMFKMAVEEAFSLGLIKVVFATETLALGINMPARTVVLDKLVKYNGISHADITPGEYTQLTGRAGRRGIDVEGHGVVTWQAGLDPRALAGLASRRTYPLKSAFTPTYNMAVNLISSVGKERATSILQDSFAQFSLDLVRSKSSKARSQRLVDKFDSLCGVLESLGYISNDAQEVTPSGKRLARLYGVHDLLIAEGIREGIFTGLSVPSLAATLSCLVYESRLVDRKNHHRMPDQASAHSVEALRKVSRQLARLEKDFHLDSAPALDLGFASPAYAWAEGATLGEIIDLSSMAAGDFVRWVRQCMDCAGQIAEAAAGSDLAHTCRELLHTMKRGVVDVDTT
ncbi:MAG: DEAD/DEAH box helicase [Propionibacteriaceae bacterium]|nr:DEAD/DEAH box helicase [Propionibacteriaceae bacterium]